MAENLQYEENILRYLDGEMDADERAAFEAGLASNQELREQFDHFSLAADAVRRAGMVQKVRSVHQEMMKELRGNKPGRVINFNVVRFSMAAAASVILLFIIVQGIIYYRVTPDGVYEDSFVNYDLSFSRGGDTRTPVAAAYASQQYDQVILMAGSLASAQDSLLTGLAFLHTGNSTEAASWFRSLSSNPAGSYREDAEYYLAMASLRAGDYETAFTLLKKIRRDDDHLYQKQVSWSTVRKVRMLKWKN